MEGVFPEALASLRNADPELYSIIEDEKERQWYVCQLEGTLPLRFAGGSLTDLASAGRASNS